MNSSNRLLQSPIDRVIGRLRSGGFDPQGDGGQSVEVEMPGPPGQELQPLHQGGG